MSTPSEDINAVTLSKSQEDDLAAKVHNPGTSEKAMYQFREHCRTASKSDLSKQISLIASSPKALQELVDYVTSLKADQVGEFIKCMRAFHDAMLPGRPLRKLLTSSLMKEFQAEGMSPTEARRAAAKKVHQSFASIVKTLDELEKGASSVDPELRKRIIGSMALVKGLFAGIVRQYQRGLALFLAARSRATGKTAVKGETPYVTHEGRTSGNAPAGTGMHVEVPPVVTALLGGSQSSPTSKSFEAIIESAVQTFVQAKQEEKKELVQKERTERESAEKGVDRELEAVLHEHERLEGKTQKPLDLKYISLADRRALAAYLRSENIRLNVRVLKPAHPQPATV